MAKPLQSLVFSLVAAAGLSTGLSTTLSAADWREVKLAAGAFRVEFPGEPQLLTRRTKTDAGQITARTHYVETDDRIVYMLTYNDYPRALFKTKTPDQVLDDTVEGVRNGVDRVIGAGPVEKIALGKHPGRAFDMKGSKDGKEVYSACRWYLVDGRLIQLMVIKTDDWVSKAERDRFFSSLKISNE